MKKEKTKITIGNVFLKRLKDFRGFNTVVDIKCKNLKDREIVNYLFDTMGPDTLYKITIETNDMNFNCVHYEQEFVEMD